jgi:osmoprotectant transport system substrate-binding protein
MEMKRLFLLSSIFLAIVLAITGCGQSSGTTAEKGPITVSSKADTEGSLLGNMIILMLKDNGFQVVDKMGIAGTSLIRQAIISGDIDIYPEYTGNGAYFFNETSSDVWKDAKAGYDRVKELDLQQNNIVWLKPAPANNTWAVAIPQALSDSEGIKTLTDFATYVNNGGYVKLAGSEEFITSEVALPAFEKAYGFTLTSDQLVTLAGGNTAQTEKAAADGTDGVNAAMAYGTDGSLSALSLVVLGDPKNVQPVYEPAPIVRGDVYDKYPQLSDILDPVFTSLDLSTLQNLNGKIAFEGQNPTTVAGDYLVAKGFLSKY